MARGNRGFVEWKEHLVSNERGSRVVHYYLIDAFGGSVLAVVGTETSPRHMVYVVSDEFLQAFGSKGCVSAKTNWRVRWQVIIWLTSMVSVHHRPSHVSTKAPIKDSVSCRVSSQEYRTREAYFQDEMEQRKWKYGSAVEWSGDASTLGKQLKHFPAFSKNESTVSVHCFVYMMSEEGWSYIGYLEDMYEDKKGQKKVKVRWFHHNRELRGFFPQISPHPREVFSTNHIQVISAECVAGTATVLSPIHYEKFKPVVAQDSKVFICNRQLTNNTVKCFSLTELSGYANQQILSSTDESMKPKGEDKEKLSPVALEIPRREPTYPKLRVVVPGKQKGSESVLHQFHFPTWFGKVELLCQDSGMRGCWFRCNVLEVSDKRLKVQYNDVNDEEGPGKLEEWVPFPREAAHDKLGMRCVGRQTIRPRPSMANVSSNIGIGTAVDAWWSDGWWEGVALGVDVSDDHILQVYLPGEGKVLQVPRENARISQDWVRNRWVQVKAKLDILFHLSSEMQKQLQTVSTDIKVPMSLKHDKRASNSLKALDRRVS